MSLGSLYMCYGIHTFQSFLFWYYINCQHNSYAVFCIPFPLNVVMYNIQNCADAYLCCVTSYVTTRGQSQRQDSSLVHGLCIVISTVSSLCDLNFPSPFERICPLPPTITLLLMYVLLGAVSDYQNMKHISCLCSAVYGFSDQTLVGFFNIICATSHWQLAGQLMSSSWLGQDFCLCCHVQISSEACSVLYSVIWGDFFFLV